MTAKPLTFGTPEHTAWAKKGEQDGLFNERFDELVDELIELVEKDKVDWIKFSRGRSDIREAFSLYEDCKCHHE